MAGRTKQLPECRHSRESHRAFTRSPRGDPGLQPGRWQRERGAQYHGRLRRGARTADTTQHPQTWRPPHTTAPMRQHRCPRSQRSRSRRCRAGFNGPKSLRATNSSPRHTQSFLGIVGCHGARALKSSRRGPQQHAQRRRLAGTVAAGPPDLSVSDLPKAHAAWPGPAPTTAASMPPPACASVALTRPPAAGRGARGASC